MLTWAIVSLLKSIMDKGMSINGDPGCLVLIALVADAFIVFVVGQIIIKIWGC